MALRKSLSDTIYMYDYIGTPGGVIATLVTFWYSVNADNIICCSWDE